ncbi:MAG: isopenicillin N synthase family oxygenase [Alphaproteobacteria bacterium]|nr:isopenicillin N synthase family oxygenase [Alphaproteobacteria bacterium]
MTAPDLDQAPRVDLRALAAPPGPEREAALEALRRGFGELGLVCVTGHDLAPEAVDGLFDALGDFVARPDAEKRAQHRPDIWYQRGWTPPNTERAVVAGGQPDFKECYFAAPLALDPEAAALYPELYAANLWPPDLPALEPALLAVGRRLHEVGRRLLAGCEEALGLPEGALVGTLDGAAHVTRALHYLGLAPDQVDAGVLWGEEHTDFNLLTVLGGGRFHDASGRPIPAPGDGSGLFLRTRPTADHPEGRVVAGRPPEGHLVAQVGQQLEVLTGGRLLATPHVIRAPRTPGITRSSVAHFLHVHALATLTPLAPFRSPEALRAYRPPVLAGTYAIKTLVDIGLAPAEALTGLGFRHDDRLALQRALEGPGGAGADGTPAD